MRFGNVLYSVGSEIDEKRTALQLASSLGRRLQRSCALSDGENLNLRDGDSSGRLDLGTLVSRELNGSSVVWVWVEWSVDDGMEDFCCARFFVTRCSDVGSVSELCLKF